MAINKRNDWDYNNRLITKTLTEYIAVHNCRPTNVELSRLSGLSRSTITRHYDSIDHNKVLQSEIRYMQLMFEPVAAAIVNSAIAGNPRSQELYLQLAFGWTKPKQFNPTPPVEPAIEPDAVETIQEIDEIIANLSRYRDDMKRLNNT